MSLVSEALKKARNEAARREASERGLVYPTVPHHLPVQRPERRVWPWAVGSGAMVALALGALLAVLAWRTPTTPPAKAASASPDDRPAPAALAERVGKAADAAAGTASTAAATDAPAKVVPAAPPAADESTSVAPAPASAPAILPAAAPVSAPDEAPRAGRATAPVARPAVEPVASAPARPAAESGTAPAASPASEAPPAAAPPAAEAPLFFVRHAELPGGVRLDLGGIAFSSGQPVALINGRALGPGEQIQGFTLTSIEPAAVMLEGAGVRVRLALKD